MTSVGNNKSIYHLVGLGRRLIGLTHVQSQDD